MKKSRYSAEQVAFALRQAESGTPVPDVCRKIGIPEQSLYRWKKRSAGMGVAEVRRLQVLLQREGWQVNHKRVYRLCRQECLNENWFLSLEDAREKIATWGEHTMYSGPMEPWATWLHWSLPRPKRWEDLQD